MAKGKKTGGRNFKKGQGGRKKGAKDKVPRGIKAKVAGSIRSMYEALLLGRPELFEDAIVKDLKSARGSVGFQHVQLAAHYLDGKPADTVNMNLDLTKLSEQQIGKLRQLIAAAQPSGS